jgi:hypothetical protein
MIETCKNCENKIGLMEKAFVYDGKIVCKECYNKLTNNVQTIEKTSKKWKGHILWCWLLFAIGLLLVTAGSASVAAEDEINASFVFGSGLITFSLIWYICTKVKIWWHHG